MTITTFIETPHQIPHLGTVPIEYLIIDLPFCSIRSHCVYDWTNQELKTLRDLPIQPPPNSPVMVPHKLILNIDGIYSDHELDIITHTINNRRLHTIFYGIRIQDPGLILWIKKHFPNMHIQLNPETGFQNAVALDALVHQGLDYFVFNHETPSTAIQSIRTPQLKYEIFVQGPICIQYSRRRFLSDRYQSDPETPIKLTAEDPELPKRLFTFLNTSFGHFMFAQFHRCLANYKGTLTTFNGVNWLIDARGESPLYFTTSLTLYSQLQQLNQDKINHLVDVLCDESKKPQKPGFFLSNNTDYDWRNTKPKAPIGIVHSIKKDDSVLIEFFIDLPMHSVILCINTDESNQTFSVRSLCTLDCLPVDSITAFTYLILPATKGVQSKGLLYLKDS